MPETVSKTDNFLKAIEKYAEQQRSRIQSEAEDFKKKELSKAEDEGLKEAYILIQKKMNDIKAEIAAGLSRAENSSRKKIFARRQEIEEEVFSEAKKKLSEYTKTPEYAAALKKSAQQIASVLKADDVVIYLRKEDMHFGNELKLIFKKDDVISKDLKSALTRNCRVEESDEIMIGGMIGISKKLGLLVDETLDSRLEEQHGWFCENSGLRVTE